MKGSRAITANVLIHPPADAWLAEVLRERGLLTAQRLHELEEEGTESLWRAGVDRGWLTDEAVVREVASYFAVPVAALEDHDPAAAVLIPEALARKHHIVPLAADDRSIRIAAADPRDIDTEQTVAFITDRAVHFEVAPPGAIDELLDELYRPERKIEQLLQAFGPSTVETIEDASPESPEDVTLEAPISRLVDALIADGVRRKASDIHAEPIDAGLAVRFRIDGILREVMRLPESAGTSLVRRIKVWARLDVTDPLHPHDGRASLRVDSHPVDLRIATSPVARGREKAVIRILDKTAAVTRLDDVGLSQAELDVLAPLTVVREGMLLMTGPTGSGKTTTLNAILNRLKTGKVNIVTVEDPVEYEIDGVSQIQVNTSQGLSFASVLRSVLRQDPDIVLVGEIRDKETAQTAIQAGLTGHYVLSTLHTNDAPSAVVRLRDMDLDAFKIAAVLKGVMAQRLVRRVCADCAQPVEAAELPAYARPPEGVAATLSRGSGCKTCEGSGYRGRVAVLEILPVTEAVATAIDRGAPPAEIAERARQAGMRTLWESGLDRMWRGLTTLDELNRVLGPPDERLTGLDSGESSDASVSDSPPTSFPVESARSTSRELPPPTEGARAKILVVDDDRLMRRLIRSVLERDGHDVTEGEDGLEALDLVERETYDLMVLDYDMPRLDGLGVLEELRCRPAGPRLPVVMLTAAGNETEARALDLGADDYLMKPLQQRSLSARVRAVLRRAALQPGL